MEKKSKNKMEKYQNKFHPLESRMAWRAGTGANSFVIKLRKSDVVQNL